MLKMSYVGVFYFAVLAPIFLPLSPNFVTMVSGVMRKAPNEMGESSSSKVIFTSAEKKIKRQQFPPCGFSCQENRRPSRGLEFPDPYEGEQEVEGQNIIQNGPFYEENEVTEEEPSHELIEDSTNSTSSAELKARPRLIAVKIPATPPLLKNQSNSGPSLYTKYPTIRLADFARRIIFPEWIWTRFAQSPINKKSEVSDGDNHETMAARPADINEYNDTLFVPSTTTRRPKGILERPTITFDNNMSRFLRLFTVVRFQNVPCIGPSGENGTCYHGKECADLGGHGTTPCAQGLGVCCLFFKSCGDTINRNGTYFVSTGAAFSRGVSTCNVNIQKLSPSIKQIRLDLQTFVMLPPNAGNCESDRFLVSGQNTNNIVPILCGNNSGSHLYVETGTSQSLIQLSVMTTGEGLRAWSIQVNQIEELHSQFSAPSHCLQYHEGTMGTITSFNYDSTLSPQYLNNLNYAICIRKEAGFCSISYSNIVPDGQYFPFQIVNADTQGNLLLPSGQAGVGLRNCPDDYLQLNGIRLCGERLNDGSKSTLMMDDAAVTDIANGPFSVIVRTNDIDVGGGFSIYYRQNPCMSTAG